MARERLVRSPVTKAAAQGGFGAGHVLATGQEALQALQAAASSASTLVKPAKSDSEIASGL